MSCKSSKIYLKLTWSSLPLVYCASMNCSQVSNATKHCNAHNRHWHYNAHQDMLMIVHICHNSQTNKYLHRFEVGYFQNLGISNAHLACGHVGYPPIVSMVFYFDLPSGKGSVSSQSSIVIDGSKGEIMGYGSTMRFEGTQSEVCPS